MAEKVARVAAHVPPGWNQRPVVRSWTATCTAVTPVLSLAVPANTIGVVEKACPCAGVPSTTVGAGSPSENATPGVGDG